MNAIQAAHAEAKGEGSFSVRGRDIVFLKNDGLSFRWSCKTEKHANDQVRLFRAATKYPATKSA